MLFKSLAVLLLATSTLACKPGKIASEGCCFKDRSVCVYWLGIYAGCQGHSHPPFCSDEVRKGCGADCCRTDGPLGIRGDKCL
ncbi:hypothetical protein EG328_001041 [Venturia inaequalis]|uniref:Uncharacterized protein n=1 Tax=Venturia inaequalis TaxID=5025 RepID=A0A8H3UZG5_VENIN|nr:hypothetical protein EG328_001041 [Venturia inaequalis]RDI88563.1 hypothetical protein Vi05172_g1051 [Venturia inaequalis]